MKVFYLSKPLNIDFGGSPLGSFKILDVSLILNLNRHFGIGVAFDNLYDDLNENSEEPNTGKAEFNALLGGFEFRPKNNIRAKVLGGIVLSGQVERWDSESKWHLFEIKNYVEFPFPAWNIEMEFRPTENLGLKLFMFYIGGEGKNQDESDSWERGSLWTTTVGLGVSYSFAFVGR